jgi:hypothetical protein
VALFLAFVVVVIALQFKAAEETVNRDRLPGLALLARLGLIGGIDPVGGALHQMAHQGSGRLEDGGAHQTFQLLNGYPLGFLSLEAGDQLLDLLVLGQEDVRRER